MYEPAVSLYEMKNNSKIIRFKRSKEGGGYVNRLLRRHVLGNHTARFLTTFLKKSVSLVYLSFFVVLRVERTKKLYVKF